MSTCVLCKEFIDMCQSNEFAKLSEKRCKSINDASKARGYDFTELVYSETSPFYIHITCRQRYINKKAVAQKRRQSSSPDIRRGLRSQAPQF